MSGPDPDRKITRESAFCGNKGAVDTTVGLAERCAKAEVNRKVSDRLIIESPARP